MRPQVGNAQEDKPEMDAETFEGLVARLNGDGDALSDEELESLDAEVMARIAAVDMTDPTEEDLEALEAAVVVHNGVGEVQAAHAAKRADRVARAQAAMAELGADADPEPETNPADDATPEADPTLAAEAPADPEAPAEVPAEVPAPETAAAPPERTPARISALSRMTHRSPSTDPRRRRQTAVQAAGLTPALLAGADLPGLPAGVEVDLERWAAAAAKRVDAILKMPAPAGFTASGKNRDGEPEWTERIHLGTVDVAAQYPEERVLDGDLRGNMDKIDAVAGRQALISSGGVCGPVAVDYSLTTLASADRPVRDGMLQFGATRGGVRYVLPHTLAAVTTDAPASIWTQATDASPGQSTKQRATFVCQTPQEKYVDAVVSYVQMGNFQARYFPEQVAQYMETVDAVHARLAEATLLAAMVAGSTAVNAGNNGTNQTGAATEFLAEVDRAAAAFRYRHRMADDAPLHIYYPEWHEDMMRADLARELPGNSGGQSERLAVADAEIDRFLSVRNINVSTFLDSPTGFATTQGWGAQNAGDLLAWPTKTLSFLTHEGAWMFLDGGELNVGMLRDSTLLGTNDVVFFSETFEKAIFRGHESLAITMDLCPDGARAGTVDTTTLCATGS